MSKKVKKTTQKQFNEFKDSFLHWRSEFGLTQYRIDFELVQLTGCYAGLDVDQSGKIATVDLALENDKGHEPYFNPVRHGLHESIHLLTSRLRWLALARFIQPSDIDEEEEALVRRIETVLMR